MGSSLKGKGVKTLHQNSSPRWEMLRKIDKQVLKKKTLLFGFGKAKPNLTFMAENSDSSWILA